MSRPGMSAMQNLQSVATRCGVSRASAEGCASLVQTHQSFHARLASSASHQKMRALALSLRCLQKYSDLQHHNRHSSFFDGEPLPRASRDDCGSRPLSARPRLRADRTLRWPDRRPPAGKRAGTTLATSSPSTPCMSAVSTRPTTVSGDPLIVTRQMRQHRLYADGNGSFARPRRPPGADRRGRQAPGLQPGLQPVWTSQPADRMNVLVRAEARGFEPRMGANPNRISSAAP